MKRSMLAMLLGLMMMAVALSSCNDDDPSCPANLANDDDDDDSVCEPDPNCAGPNQDWDSEQCECVCDTDSLNCREGQPVDEEACECIAPTFTVDPATGGSFGETVVTVTSDQPIFADMTANHVRVLLGEVDIIFKEITSDNTLVGRTQGHPAPSNDNDQPFTVGLSVKFQSNIEEVAANPRTLPTWEDAYAQPNLFTYDPPIDPIFNNFWAIGASFCAGFQADSLNAPAQLMGPAAQVARQVGAYFPLPLARDPGIPPKPTLANVNPQTGSTDIDTAEALMLLIPSLTKGHFLDIRENPYTFTHNTSVPGGVVEDILVGASGEFGLLENFIQDPFVLGSRTLTPPIELLETNHPTLVMSSVDVFGNNVLGGDDYSTLTIEAQLDELFGRFTAIDTQPMLFILSLPDVNALPGETFAQDERYEVIRANNALQRAAARANEGLAAPRVIFGDFFSRFVELLEANPGDFLTFGGASFEVVAGPNGEGNFLITDLDGNPQQMSLDRFGGLISFDDLHLTDTGYAWLANAVIETMNDVMGPNGTNPVLTQDIGFIDLGAVLTDDPYSPLHLTEQTAELGFPPLVTFADAVAVPDLAFWDRCAIEFSEALSLGVEDGCPAELVIVDPVDLSTAPDANLVITVEVRDKDGLPIEGIPVVGNPWNKNDSDDRLQPERGQLTGPDGRAVMTLEPRGNAEPVDIFIQAGGVIETYTVTKQ